MDKGRESIDQEWQRINAKVDKTEKDLKAAEKKLDKLKLDVEFWSIVLKSDDKASE